METAITVVAAAFAAAVAAYLIWQIRALRRALALRGAPVPEAAVPLLPGGRKGRMMLYFFSPRCGACKGMTPRVQALADAGEPVAVVDVARQPELARAFRVMGTPTTVLLRDGRIAEVLIGAQGDRRLRRLLD